MDQTVPELQMQVQIPQSVDAEASAGPQLSVPCARGTVQ